MNPWLWNRGERRGGVRSGGSNHRKYAFFRPKLGYNRDGTLLSRAQRGRRPSRGRLRARHRIALFLVLTALSLLLGHRVAAVFALVAVVSGIFSLRAARVRCNDAGYSFMVADWLFLGCIVALSGGTGSWLLLGVPLLAAGHLAGVAPRERAYFMAPAALLLVILAIADPSLGGNRLLGFLEVVALCGGGWVAAGRLRRWPTGRRRPAAVGSAAGLAPAKALRGVLERELASARSRGTSEALAIVSLRLERGGRSPARLSGQKKDRMVGEVLRLAEGLLPSAGRAFHGAADEIVLVMPGCSLCQATELISEIALATNALLGPSRRRLLAGAACSSEVAEGVALVRLARRRSVAGFAHRAAEPDRAAVLVVNQ